MAFFRHLSVRDARNNIAHLRHLASKAQLGKIYGMGLVIRIDYTVIPPEYDVVSLAEFEKHAPMPLRGPNAEPMHTAIVQEAHDNPGIYTIIVSKVANGQGLQLVPILIKGEGFWMDSPSSRNDTTGGVGE